MKKIFPSLILFFTTAVFTSASGFAVYAGASCTEMNQSLNKENVIEDENFHLNKVEQKDFEDSLKS